MAGEPQGKAGASALTKLSLANLPGLAPGVARPTYERASLTAGIAHIGVGNFHRAHQAFYLHRLFNTGRDHDWAITGAGIKPYDAAMRDKLAAQDWLTTIVELDPEGFSAEICGSMVGYDATDPESLVMLLSQPHIRIVSLTVTEGGYYLNAKTGGFDNTHPDMVADAVNPGNPQTVFGAVIAAAMARRAAGTAPFTVMSCDNLPGNGHVAAGTVLGLAAMMDGDQAEWIGANIAFPNGMVDCITPATGPRELDIVRTRFGIEDAAPVVCEPFRQWVMEDVFPGGRPALEDVGVEFVSDVAPYELMKLRILNGGHATIAYPAALMGIEYAHDAMRDPLVAGFLEKLEFTEIIPTVPEIPGVSLADYYKTVVRRFSNQALGDTIARLCLDGSNRQPKFILPTAMARLEAGQPVDGLALEVALWCRYCAGTDDAGKEIFLDDPSADRLRAQALRAKDEPTEYLAMRDIFGPLADSEPFRTAFSRSLRDLWRDGTAATLRRYLAAN